MDISIRLAQNPQDIDFVLPYSSTFKWLDLIARYERRFTGCLWVFHRTISEPPWISQLCGQSWLLIQQRADITHLQQSYHSAPFS